MSLDQTIAQFYGLRQDVVSYRRKERSSPGVDPTLLLGVEFEIENTNGILGDHQSHLTGGMSVKEDGSLRNNGLEFITKPMQYDSLATTTRDFFERNKWGPENYSERCSIHVHANCRDLTLAQLGSVLMLYQGFEKLLYQFVGAERDKNIFCVPWSESMMTYNIVNTLSTTDTAHNTIRRWQKYLGLNLLRLQDLGTIEFRHMPGIYDVSKILVWYQIIGCLFKTARALPMEELKTTLTNLNTSSAYDQVMEMVFGEYAHYLRSPGYTEALEEGILNLKFMIMGDKTPALPPRARFTWEQATFGTVNEPVGEVAGMSVYTDRELEELANIVRGQRT